MAGEEGWEGRGDEIGYITEQETSWDAHGTWAHVAVTAAEAN